MVGWCPHPRRFASLCGRSYHRDNTLPRSDKRGRGHGGLSAAGGLIQFIFIKSTTFLFSRSYRRHNSLHDYIIDISLERLTVSSICIFRVQSSSILVRIHTHRKEKYQLFRDKTLVPNSPLYWRIFNIEFSEKNYELWIHTTLKVHILQYW